MISSLKSQCWLLNIRRFDPPDPQSMVKNDPPIFATKTPKGCASFSSLAWCCCPWCLGLKNGWLDPASFLLGPSVYFQGRKCTVSHQGTRSFFVFFKGSDTTHIISVASNNKKFVSKERIWQTSPLDFYDKNRPWLCIPWKPLELSRFYRAKVWWRQPFGFMFVCPTDTWWKGFVADFSTSQEFIQKPSIILLYNIDTVNVEGVG